MKTQKAWCFVSTFTRGNWCGSSVVSDYFIRDLCPSSSSWVPWSSLGLLSEFAKSGPGANPVLEECPLQGPPLHPPTSFSFPLEEGLPWLTRVGASVPSGVEVRCPEVLHFSKAACALLSAPQNPCVVPPAHQGKIYTPVVRSPVALLGGVEKRREDSRD